MLGLNRCERICNPAGVTKRKERYVSAALFFLPSSLTLKHPLTSNNYKLYVLTDPESILYVGTTKSSIKNRLRSGLFADGKNGYYGYKWKGLSLVKLYVWCFEELDKMKAESIEAELVYLIRKKTGRWPIYQNEIHFNNHYTFEGKAIAKKLFEQLR